jgi:hypothetical protein
MKIKLLACFAFATILSSCTKEEEILPKQNLNTKSPTEILGIGLKGPTEFSGLVHSQTQPESTNFNNSWPLAK